MTPGNGDLSLRDYLDALRDLDQRFEARFRAHTDAMTSRIADMERSNSEEHEQVVDRFERLEEHVDERFARIDKQLNRLDGVVTWRSLGFAIATTAALSTVVAAVASLL